MSPQDASPPAGLNGTPAPGLPPVAPPSGRFIAQLFLVPGSIVAFATIVILIVGYVADSGRTPEYFLAKLNSDNDDIRWRGASDLAQHIKRTESKQLKTDTKFALDLAQLLRTNLDDLRKQEQEMAAKIAKLPKEEQEAAWRRLAPKKRAFIEFLAPALGDFYVPVGVPILCEMINDEASPDLQGNTLRRRKAIWALSNLGDHVKSIANELRPEDRARMSEQLRAEMAGEHAERAAWARTALYYLDKDAVAQGASGLVLVDEKLAQCAKTQDRFMRVQIAMALNFWDGDLVEPTLLRLAKDDGFGTLLRITEDEPVVPTEKKPRSSAP